MGMLLITAAMLAAAQDVEIVEIEVLDKSSPHIMFMQIAKTREETAAKAAELFDQRDTDENGYLEGEERHFVSLDMPHIAMVRDRHLIPPGPDVPHQPKMSATNMFSNIDKDGDGSISREEFEDHHKHHGRHTLPSPTVHPVPGGSMDDDRRVVVERIVRDDAEPKKKIIVKRLEDVEWNNVEGRNVMLERVQKMAEASDEDADGDGRVSRQEAIDKALERFDAMDEDGDGKLDESENVYVMKSVVERKD